MQNKVTDVQIIPIKPNNGLIAFANIIYNNALFLGSIGIHTRPCGGYRLVYPSKNSGDKFNIFHPINRITANEIENAVIAKYIEMIDEVPNMKSALSD